VYAGARTYELRTTLAAIELKLNPRHFARIHRSTIVNLSKIKEIHPWFHGHHRVLLLNGKELRMSRYQSESVKRLLGKLEQ
jgi:two-component system, LytTR family, response regulator